MSDESRAPIPSEEKSPFQRIIDELTDGCGCACHLGTGYRTTCFHCCRRILAEGYFS